MDEFYQDGYQAYLAGLSRGACPQTSRQNRISWLQGYAAAERDDPSYNEYDAGHGQDESWY